MICTDSTLAQVVLACSAGVFFERAICSRKRHVQTSRREEEMGQVKGSGEGAGREKRKRVFFLPSPSPLSFFLPRTYRTGYYFYSPQSSTVIKSKMVATTILRTLACVASVSARVRRERRDESKKKRNDGGGGGERRNLFHPFFFASALTFAQ